MDTHELAWAAGFFDGEGCTAISRMGQSKWPCLTLVVGQVNPLPLQRMAAAFGFGSVSGPFRRRNEHQQPIYQYRVCNFEQAQAGIAMMWPWLSRPKWQQAAERLRAVAEWEATGRLRRMACVDPTHAKASKGRCVDCQKARQATEKYKLWNRENARRYRLENPEKCRASKRAAYVKRRAADPEKMRAYSRAYYAANRERLRAYHRAYDAKKRTEKEV